MEKRELNNFYNDGFGWICKLCEADLQKAESLSDTENSRLMSEGEAESKQPRFSNVALAQWTDKTNQTLMCPRCGVIESVDKS